MRTSRHHLPTFAAALAALVLVPGCGGDDGGEPASTPTLDAPVVTTPTLTDATSRLEPEAQQQVDEAVSKGQQGDSRGAAEALRRACVAQARAQLSGADEQRAIEICERGAP